MPTPRDDLAAHIKRLEPAARDTPRRYLLRVAALVVLTYATMALLLVGSVVVLAALAWLAIHDFEHTPIRTTLVVGFFCFGLICAIGRGVWVRLDPPPGLPVTAKTAPALFALLKEVCAKLDCAPFHKVLITGEFNACVMQVPRLGMLGWHRNYLVLGLPLMQALDPDEFKSVLAHEAAHCSRNHGRLSNWLYRVRETWERIYQKLDEQQNASELVVRLFVRWYWPILNAHAFALSRANEYEADAFAAKLAGADASARALMRIQVLEGWLGRVFWEQLERPGDRGAEPPHDVYALLSARIRQPCPPPVVESVLYDAFTGESDNVRTHPSLTDRLRAMDRLPEGSDEGRFPTELPPAPLRSAAQELLGEAEGEFEQRLSEQWRKLAEARWSRREF